MVDWLAEMVKASTIPGFFFKSPGRCALVAMMVAEVAMIVLVVVQATQFTMVRAKV